MPRVPVSQSQVAARLPAGFPEMVLGELTEGGRGVSALCSTTNTLRSHAMELRTQHSRGDCLQGCLGLGACGGVRMGTPCGCPHGMSRTACTRHHASLS